VAAEGAVRVTPGPLPAFDVGALVPSTRDLLQAIRTRRSGLVLVPLLSTEEAGREALRDTESGVTALAMGEPGPAMAAASAATRVPVVCLRPVAAKEDYLAARAFGADAVVLAPGLDEAARQDLSKGARSTRMMALDVARDAAGAKRAAETGARALVLQAPDVATIKGLATGLPSGVTLLAWPDRAAEEDVRALVGVVDAVIVGVDVYGATGFERLVSELNP
jgi:hypothetical protein